MSRGEISIESGKQRLEAGTVGGIGLESAS